MILTLITIRLQLLSPGGVAGPERRQGETTPNGEPSNHIPLRRDPDGAVALPGSTAAGSLRTHCVDWPGLPDGLFGGEPGAEEKVASPVQVLGVRCHGAVPAVESAVRVAIDRHRGAAQVHALFTVEQLPAGTEFDIHLRWDGAGTALDSFLDAVRAWRPRIGRGVTTGSGSCAVTGLAWDTYDLTKADRLLAWLAVEGPETYPQPTEVLAVSSSPDPEIDVQLDIVDGLHIGSGVPSQLPDHDSEVALVVQRHDVPHVPGSSLKGVLRSRVEYICRVLGQPACADARCGACRACHLFGWSPRSGADPELGGARAAVAIPDAKIDAADVEVRHHVALDRVTGGARSGLLYAQQVVVAGNFRLRVEPLRPLTDVELALLRASVADLHDGLVGVGAAATRGLGTVRVNDATWVPPDLSALAALVSGGPDA
ncbi:MAG: RAMP superfamily CRISPR-associated protein [Pseudonocardiaceae bacterium]